MMGRTHALTGWCAGLALAPVVGADSAPQAAVFAVTTAGFALLPDLDHPGARASKLLGSITGGLSWLLRRASAALYRATKGPRDERRAGTHRHLSHTLLFALALGGVAMATTHFGGWYAVAVVVLLGVLLAQDALGDWVFPVAAGAVIWWIATAGSDADQQLHQLGGWLGIAVAAGCFVHCLGDALTESGCPFLFPLLIAGETWYEIRPPSWLRFSTGKKVENRLIFPVFAVLAALLVPGMWGLVTDLAAKMFEQSTVQAGS
jgi:membrane-bound metal-dependent hydrolase YbcI (DUF457 family)